MLVELFGGLLSDVIAELSALLLGSLLQGFVTDNIGSITDSLVGFLTGLISGIA